MITYKDKTFCASQTDKHTCGRVITEQEKKEAEKIKLPVAYGFFCEELNK